MLDNLDYEQEEYEQLQSNPTTSATTFQNIEGIIHAKTKALENNVNNKLLASDPQTAMRITEAHKQIDQATLFNENYLQARKNYYDIALKHNATKVNPHTPTMASDPGTLMKLALSPDSQLVEANKIANTLRQRDEFEKNRIKENARLELESFAAMERLKRFREDKLKLKQDIQARMIADSYRANIFEDSRPTDYTILGGLKNAGMGAVRTTLDTIGAIVEGVDDAAYAVGSALNGKNLFEAWENNRKVTNNPVAYGAGLLSDLISEQQYKLNSKPLYELEDIKDTASWRSPFKTLGVLGHTAVDTLGRSSEEIVPLLATGPLGLTRSLALNTALKATSLERERQANQEKIDPNLVKSTSVANGQILSNVPEAAFYTGLNKVSLEGALGLAGFKKAGQYSPYVKPFSVAPNQPFKKAIPKTLATGAGNVTTNVLGRGAAGMIGEGPIEYLQTLTELRVTNPEMSAVQMREEANKAAQMGMIVGGATGMASGVARAAKAGYDSVRSKALSNIEKKNNEAIQKEINSINIDEFSTDTSNFTDDQVNTFKDIYDYVRTADPNNPPTNPKNYSKSDIATSIKLASEGKFGKEAQQATLKDIQNTKSFIANVNKTNKAQIDEHLKNQNIVESFLTASHLKKFKNWARNIFGGKPLNSPEAGQANHQINLDRIIAIVNNPKIKQHFSQTDLDKFTRAINAVSKFDNKIKITRNILEKGYVDAQGVRHLSAQEYLYKILTSTPQDRNLAYNKLTNFRIGQKAKLKAYILGNTLPENTAVFIDRFDPEAEPIITNNPNEIEELKNTKTKSGYFRYSNFVKKGNITKVLGQMQQENEALDAIEDVYDLLNDTPIDTSETQSNKQTDENSEIAKVNENSEIKETPTTESKDAKDPKKDTTKTKSNHTSEPTKDTNQDSVIEDIEIEENIIKTAQARAETKKAHTEPKTAHKSTQEAKPTQTTTTTGNSNNKASNELKLDNIKEYFSKAIDLLNSIKDITKENLARAKNFLLDPEALNLSKKDIFNKPNEELSAIVNKHLKGVVRTPSVAGKMLKVFEDFAKDIKTNGAINKYGVISNTAVFFENPVVQRIATLRGLESLLSSKFNYQTYDQIKEFINTTFGVESVEQKFDYELYNKIKDATLVNNFSEDLGKNIANDIGLEMGKTKISDISLSQFYQELGRVTLSNLEQQGLLEKVGVPRSDLIADETSQVAVNFVKLTQKGRDLLRDKDGKRGATIKAFNALFDELNLEQTLENREELITKPIKFSKARYILSKFKQKLNKAQKLVIGRLNNTPYVCANANELRTLWEPYLEQGEVLDPNLNQGYKNRLPLYKALGYTEITKDTWESKKESIKGKNLEAIRTVDALLDYLTVKNEDGSFVSDTGIYFDAEVGGNYRVYYTSQSGLNPQAIKLHRHLLAPQKVASKKLKLIKKDDGSVVVDPKLADQMFISIAQGFDFSVDKKPLDENRAFATNLLKEIMKDHKTEESFLNKFNEAIAKGEKEFYGVELSENFGHLTSSVLNIANLIQNINTLKNSKNKTSLEFEQSFHIESDGANNGLTLKHLIYMLSPSYFNGLLAGGVSIGSKAAANIAAHYGKNRIKDNYKLIAAGINKVFGDLPKNPLNDYIRSMYDIDEEGNVSKKSRANAKPIGTVFGYGAGNTSQINPIANNILEELQDLVFEYLQNPDQATNEQLLAWNLFRYIDPKTAKQPKAKILDLIQNHPRGLFGESRADKILRKRVHSLQNNLTYKVLGNLYPGMQFTNDLITNIQNGIIRSVREIMQTERTKRENELGRKFTRAEVEDFIKEYEDKLPYIKVSLGNTTSALYNVVNRRFSTDKNDSVQVMLPEKSKDGYNKTATINPSQMEVGEIGASGNVLSTHQEDTFIININPFMYFYGTQIFDAFTTDLESSIPATKALNQAMAQSAFDNNIFETIVKSSQESLDFILQNLSTKNKEVAKLQENLDKLKLMLQIKQHNLEVVKHTEITFHNYQAGLDSSYTYIPKHKLPDNINPQELMLDVLDYIKDNKIDNIQETSQKLQNDLKIKQEELAKALELNPPNDIESEIKQDLKSDNINESIDNTLDNSNPIPTNKIENKINTGVRRNLKANLYTPKKGANDIDLSSNQSLFGNKEYKMSDFSFDNIKFAPNTKVSLNNKFLATEITELDVSNMSLNEAINEAKSKDLFKDLTANDKIKSQMEYETIYLPLLTRWAEQSSNKNKVTILSNILNWSNNIRLYSKDINESKAWGDLVKTKLKSDRKESIFLSYENEEFTEKEGSDFEVFSKTLQSNPDSVNEMKDFFRQMDIDKNQNTSEEHSQRLTDVLSKLINPITNSIKDLTVVLQELPSKVNSGQFVADLNKIIIKSSTNPLFAGFMSREEVFAHELTHSATYYAIMNNHQGTSAFRRELQYIYNRFVKEVSVEDIANELNLKSKEENLRVAKIIYDHFTTKDMLTNLHEFTAIGLTSDVMAKLLSKLKYEEKQKQYSNLFDMLFDKFCSFFEKLFMKDTLAKVSKDTDLFTALTLLSAKMAKANQRAKAQSQKQSRISMLGELNNTKFKIDKISSEYVKKAGETIKNMLPVNFDKIPVNQNIRQFATNVVLSMIDKDFRQNFQAMLDVSSALNHDSLLGTIINEISDVTPPARVAQQLSMASSRLDSHRNTIVETVSQTLRSYLSKPLTQVEEEILGEVLLDTDITSLDLDSSTLSQILKSKDVLEKHLLQANTDLTIAINNSFKPTNKITKAGYSNFVRNKANELAEFLVTHKVEYAGLIMNASSIANLAGLKKDYKANPKIIKALDKYITLKALMLTSPDMREKAGRMLEDDSKGFNNILTYIKSYNERSRVELFDNNPTQMIKGYRIDIFAQNRHLKIDKISNEKKLAAQGYKPVYSEISDETKLSENKRFYINTTFGSEVTYNRQAFRYSNSANRGTSLNDLFQMEVAENPENYEELKTEYDSIVNKTNNQHRAALLEALKPNYKGIKTSLAPILDTQGQIQGYRYIINKKTKFDVLGNSTNLFDSLAYMQGSLFDKVQSAKLNEKVIQAVADDYHNASFKEKHSAFVEFSLNSKDELVRESFKMIPIDLRKKLQSKFQDGKVMVRAETFKRYFGTRVMDVRHFKFYKQSDNKIITQIPLYAQEILSALTKAVKLEIVIKTPKVILGNLCSNIVLCINAGLTPTQAIKWHFEAVKTLEKYQKDRQALDKLQFDKMAGLKVNPAYENALIDNLKSNPVYPLIKAGLYNTISFENLQTENKTYLEEQYEKVYNKLPKAAQMTIDTIFLTNNTKIGRGLTKFVHLSDFISRYSLYYGYLEQGVNPDTALHRVIDYFIDYDTPQNRGLEYANKLGFVMFSRYFLGIQRVLKSLISEAPFSSALTLIAQYLIGTNVFLEDPYEGSLVTKNYGTLFSDPYHNFIKVKSPPLANFIP